MKLYYPDSRDTVEQFVNFFFIYSLCPTMEKIATWHQPAESVLLDRI